MKHVGGDCNMPRHARVLSKTQVYHIMLRGNELKNIFYDDDDKDRFVNTLFLKKESDRYSLYAYCIMDNHVHLLLREREEPIAKSIKKIAVSYAYYYNHKYQRIGHVFQDRYRSENVEDDSYLLTAVRYIHNNPEKARISLRENYKWSSYHYYIEGSHALPEIHEVLRIFSEKLPNAIRRFEEFSRKETDSAFIDIEELKTPEIHEGNVDQFITQFAVGKGIGREEMLNNRKLTAILIREIQNRSNLSLRKIAEVIGLNRETARRLIVSREPSP
jgi:putative transposase